MWLRVGEPPLDETPSRVLRRGADARCYEDVRADYSGEADDAPPAAGTPADIKALCRKLQDALTQQCQAGFVGEKWLKEELDDAGWWLKLSEKRVQDLVEKKMPWDFGDYLHKLYLRDVCFFVPDLRHGPPTTNSGRAGRGRGDTNWMPPCVECRSAERVRFQVRIVAVCAPAPAVVLLTL